MSQMSPVMQAASNGETFRLKSLIEKGEKVNEGDTKGFTPLHAAVNGGFADCVEVLVELGKANVNVKDRDGTTPLHIACTLNSLEMVKFLLANGATPNVEDRNGFPIHCCATGDGNVGFDAVSTASGGGNAVAVLKELVQAGANVDAKNRSSRTALHIACKDGKVALVQALIAAGANKNMKDGLGMSAMDFAEGNPELKTLLQ